MRRDPTRLSHPPRPCRPARTPGNHSSSEAGEGCPMRASTETKDLDRTNRSLEQSGCSAQITVAGSYARLRNPILPRLVLTDRRVFAAPRFPAGIPAIVGMRVLANLLARAIPSRPARPLVVLGGLKGRAAGRRTGCCHVNRNCSVTRLERTGSLVRGRSPRPSCHGSVDVIGQPNERARHAAVGAGAVREPAAINGS